MLFCQSNSRHEERDARVVQRFGRGRRPVAGRVLLRHHVADSRRCVGRKWQPNGALRVVHSRFGAHGWTGVDNGVLHGYAVPTG